MLSKKTVGNMTLIKELNIPESWPKAPRIEKTIFPKPNSSSSSAAYLAVEIASEGLKNII